MAERRDVTIQRTRNGYVQVVAGGEVVASYRGGDKARRDAEERASRLRIEAAVLDDHIPLRGPCGLCGVPGVDQTHRVIDSIAGMARAHMRDDEDVEWVAEEFGYPEEHSAAIVAACLAWTAHHRG